MAIQGNDKYDSLQQPAESKQALAYQQIKEDILNNTYPEGTVMVERKLCDIYNMSRSPIRNALQQLTHEGLLTFVPEKEWSFRLLRQKIFWKCMI
ncbi:MAG: GntR family transcriptional regulator [Eubacterium sp.]